MTKKHICLNCGRTYWTIAGNTYLYVKKCARCRKLFDDSFLEKTIEWFRGV